jgi:hypothetical protein
MKPGPIAGCCAAPRRCRRPCTDLLFRSSVKGAAFRDGGGGHGCKVVAHTKSRLDIGTQIIHYTRIAFLIPTLLRRRRS